MEVLMTRCKAPTRKPRIRTPFPYFGNKRAVADTIWARLGDVRTFVDPFAGSGAVLLARPDDHKGGREVINDADGLLVNFWRAAKADADAVIEHASGPVAEVDNFARHGALVDVRPQLAEQLRDDPEFFDAKLAGWWLKGQSSTIGSGWCQGRALRQMPAVGTKSGIHAACGPDRLRWVADRIQHSYITCGDWKRLRGRTTLGLTSGSKSITGVVLDPPYGEGVTYALEQKGVAAEVWDWACEVGGNPQLRIVVCGYEDERVVPTGWTVQRSDANQRQGGSGYENHADAAGRARAKRETMRFSPHCLAA